MKVFLLALLCFSSIFQSTANPVNGDNSMKNDLLNADPLILTLNLFTLFQKLDQKNIHSLLPIIQNWKGTNDAESMSKLANWYSELSPEYQQQVKNWLSDQVKESERVRQRAMELMNQNNISPKVKSAWEGFQKYIFNPNSSDEWRNTYSPLTITEKLQFDMILLRVYGGSLGNLFKDLVNNLSVSTSFSSSN